MRIPRRVDRLLDAGLQRIRDQFGVPAGFPPEVALAAIEASRRTPGPDHVDRTDRPFVTLDPASSTDLDQAFAIERGRRRHRAALRDRRCRVLRCAPATPSTRRLGGAASPCTCPTSGRACTRPRSRRAPPACSPTGPARPWCSPCASTPTVTSGSTASSVPSCAAGPSWRTTTSEPTISRPTSSSWPGASRSPRSGVARRGWRSPNRTSSASTATGSCASLLAW